MITMTPSMCTFPYGQDPELERLRELERQALIEREKQAIRDRLRRMGYPAVMPWPGLPCPLPSDPYAGWRSAPYPILARHAPLTLDQVLRQIPR